jgi:hypothetical protein
MKIQLYHLLFFLFVPVASFAQVFITVDKDTHEFVENVSYTLFKQKKPVRSAVTFPDKVNVMDADVVFDSIALYRVDYETLGMAKMDMDSVVYLTRKIFYLDELVIGSDDAKELLLGETNRFIKHRSAAMTDSLVYGLVFSNGTSQDYVLNKMAFYVDKVRVKTAYRVNFIHCSEDLRQDYFQLLEPGAVIYATDTLYLNPGDKNKVEVGLPEGFTLSSTKKMFVWVQLLGYYDGGGKAVVPEYGDLTKIKFQLSNKTDYYSRMYDGVRNTNTDFIVNRNVMLNHDYASRFYTAPPKSVLLAPAIVLHARRAQPGMMNGVKNP